MKNSNILAKPIFLAQHQNTPTRSSSREVRISTLFPVVYVSRGALPQKGKRALLEDLAKHSVIADHTVGGCEILISHHPRNPGFG